MVDRSMCARLPHALVEGPGLQVGGSPRSGLELGLAGQLSSPCLLDRVHAGGALVRTPARADAGIAAERLAHGRGGRLHGGPTSRLGCPARVRLVCAPGPDPGTPALRDRLRVVAREALSNLRRPRQALLR
jgi:hypothetical protein